MKNIKYLSLIILSGYSIFLLICVFLFATSCGSTPPVTEKPVEAKIPELYISYLKNNKWIPYTSQGSNFFSVGEPYKIKVRTHSKGGKCEIKAIDGNVNIVKNCEGKSETILDLGEFNENTPSALGISVAMEKLGNQFGYFYPEVKPAYTPVKIKNFSCPLWSSQNGISNCSRPATYKFSGFFLVEGNRQGLSLLSYSCSSGQKDSKEITVEPNSQVAFEINRDTPDFCVVTFSLRQGELRARHRVYIRFYSPKYVPLSDPVERNGKICAVDQIEAYSVNGKDKTVSWGSSDCISDKGEILLWDKIGRFKRVLR